jgi:F-type H+-transporting ATPase subunit a
MISPLEQFELSTYFSFNLFNFDLQFTNSTLFIIVNFFLLISFLLSGITYLKLIPNNWELINEFFYSFLLTITKQQVGKAGLGLLPLFICTFFFILLSNIVGLLPLAFTVTSHVIITWTLGFTFNLGFLIYGLTIHNIKFFNLFIPKGVPLVLMPLIIVIEIVSYLLRTFSLSIRLFANMMAGHALLHILTSFVIIISNLFLSFIPLILVLAVLGLEIGICFLQAYVFLVLLNIYYKDALSPSH